MASPAARLTLAALAIGVAAAVAASAAEDRSSGVESSGPGGSSDVVASAHNAETVSAVVGHESVREENLISGLNAAVSPTPTDNDILPVLHVADFLPGHSASDAPPSPPAPLPAFPAIPFDLNLDVIKPKDPTVLPGDSSLPLSPSFTQIPSGFSSPSPTPPGFISLFSAVLRPPPLASASSRTNTFSSTSATRAPIGPPPDPLVLPAVPASAPADLAGDSPPKPVSSAFFPTARISATPVSSTPVSLTSFTAPVSTDDGKKGIEYYTNTESRAPVFLQKCCKRDEELNEALQCVKRSDSNATIDEKEKPWVYPNDTHIFHWLPKEFDERSVRVHLNMLRSPRRLSLVLADIDDTENYSLSEDGKLIVYVRQGYELELKSNDYCVDSINGNNPVFVSWNCGTHHCFNKCCPRNQVLISRNGEHECVEPVSRDPPTPIFFEHYLSVNYLIHDRTYTRCVNGTFQLLRRDDFYPDEIIDFISATESKPLLVKEYSESDVCGDWILSEDGTEEGVVGYCARKLSTWRLLWVTSQALCVPAAFFLLVSLLAVAVMPELRATTHGRALTCHAASLFLFNGLHVVARYFSRHPKFWQYFEFNFPSCRYKAYFAHFSLHAANFWLNVVSINIALGFRRAQRAPAAGKNRWRTFLFYSIYAWGCPILLTILTIVCWEREIAREPGITKLAFLETRTCFFDYAESTENKFSSSTLYLYYLPTSLLLISNVGLFIYTTYKICSLRKDTALVRRPGEGREAAAHDSAWLYVRLLVSTGIVEAAIEVATWSASSETIPDRRDDTLEMLKNTITPYEVMLNTVDVVRAVFIFWATCCAPRILVRVRARLRKTLSSGRRIWQLRGGLRPDDTELGPVTTSSGRTGEDVIVTPVRSSELNGVTK